MTAISTSKPKLTPAKLAPIGIALTGLTSLGVYQLLRAQPLHTQPTIQPAKSYAEALTKIEALASTEAALSECCKPFLLTHGHKTNRAIALIHGYTNCPQQFRQLAPLFFQQGYNVYVARMPVHGFADRFSPLQSRLNAPDLAQWTEQVVDVLCGLGEQTTLLGFSMGGVLAGWAATHRPELDQVVMVSPALAVQGVPLNRRQLYANLFNLFPNIFQWWDTELKDSRKGPPQAYPRWATHGVGSMLRLAGLLEESARSKRPAAKKITVITNPSDEAVDNQGAERIVDLWRRQGVQVNTHSFDESWKLIHDLMDPDQPEQQVARVYPQLLQWVT